MGRQGSRRSSGDSQSLAARAGGSGREHGEATLDYVPQHSEREGGLLFLNDPARHERQLRVKGYVEP